MAEVEYKIRKNFIDLETEFHKDKNKAYLCFKGFSFLAQVIRWNNQNI